MIWGRFGRRRLLEAAQLLFGLLALLWVVTQPDWAAIQNGIVELSGSAIIAILAVTFVGLIAKFSMWITLLAEHCSTGLRSAGHIELSVNFVNQLLPSRLSGRVAAPFVVQRYTDIGWEQAVAVSIAHTGLFALLYGLVSLSGFLAGVDRFSAGLSLLILLSTGLYLVAGITILGAASGLDGALGRRLSTVTDLPVVSSIKSTVTDRVLDFPLEITVVAPLVREFLSEPRTLVPFSLGWGIALVAAPGMRLWLLFEGMGGQFEPLWMLPLFAVAAYSVTLLPLTPGGIGVTEATATLVFIAVGVPSSIVVPAVLIDRFVGVYLPALAGWYPTMSIGLDEIRRDDA